MGAGTSPLASLAGVGSRLDQTRVRGPHPGYLVPYLGGIQLGALTARDVQEMFTAIARDETALGRPGQDERHAITGPG